MPTIPDPARLGGLEWARRTNGRLTRSERRQLLAAIVRGQGSYIATRSRRMTGRVPVGARDLAFADFRPPDSGLARLAEEAAEEQSIHVKGHGYRTWAFGAALAALDRSELEPEVFYVASLLHDYGVDDVVAGEDFVLRSATRAEQCVADAGLGEAIGLATADAITVHSTAGITVEHDGAGRLLRQCRCGSRPRRAAVRRPPPFVPGRRPRGACPRRRDPGLRRAHRRRGTRQPGRPIRPAAPMRLQPAAAHEPAGPRLIGARPPWR